MRVCPANGDKKPSVLGGVRDIEIREPRGARTELERRMGHGTELR